MGQVGCQEDLEVVSQKGWKDVPDDPGQSDWQGLAGVEVVGWTKPPSTRLRRWEWACFDPGGPVEVEVEVDLPRRSEVSRRWVHPSAQGRGTASSPGGSHS